MSLSSSSNSNSNSNINSNSNRGINDKTNSEEINEFRNQMKIKVRGNVVPNPVSTFSDMKIHPKIINVLLSNIEKSQWKEPTPIQMQAIPAQLLGRDIMASAPTGSGKNSGLLNPHVVEACYY
jgi:superfamily II DNA/RNA helicase